MGFRAPWLFRYLLFSLVLPSICKAELALLIAEVFENPKEPLKIRSDRTGAIYIRGFPRGAWGSHLFPALTTVESEPNDTLIQLDRWADLEKVKRTPVAKGDYKQFVNKLRNLFCEDWLCCSQKTRESCSNPPAVARQIMEYIIDPYQTLPLTFSYRWCAQAWEQYRNLMDSDAQTQLMKQIDKYCPDPCHGNPCRNVKNVNISAFCKITGPFENDYTCDCKNYSLWNPNLLTCQRINPCLSTVFSPCKAENTALCVARDEETAICICKSEYMGKDCSLPRDACQERLNKSQPNGYTRCQVSLGNECHPILGTDAYTCVCRYGYAPSFKISEDNCLTRWDPCRNAMFGEESNETLFTQNRDTSQTLEDELVDNEDLIDASVSPASRIIHRGITCMNGGYCVSSADFTRALCVCPTSGEGEPLYRGLNCEIPVGVWSAWSHMSKCLPSDCGKNRYRWRRRLCLNGTSVKNLQRAGRIPRKTFSEIQRNFTPAVHCIGTSEEIISCDPMEACVSIRLPGYIRDEILNYQTLYYFGYITAAQVVISLLSWYVLVIPAKKVNSTKKYDEARCCNNCLNIENKAFGSYI